MPTSTNNRPANDPKIAMPDKALKVLANSIFQTLKDEGCKNKDIIGISSQLIGLVTSQIDHDKNPPSA